MSDRIGRSRCWACTLSSTQPWAALQKRRSLGMHIQAYTLRRRHALLDWQIAEEARRPVPDSLRLQSLKRQKLALKERLSALEAPNYAFA
jgi:hypothetical protein